VSRLVASLERDIGGALFERTSRRVTLTPLGATLRESLLPAHSQLLAALDNARLAARATEGRLSVGFTSTTASPALSRLIQTFQARHPSCEVRLNEVENWRPYTTLHTGETDVLVNWLAVDEADLTAGPVIDRRRRILAVARGHRLASRPSVSLEDIADETVAQPPPEFPAALCDAILPPCTPSGRPIHRAEPSHTVHEIFEHVASGPRRASHHERHPTAPRRHRARPDRRPGTDGPLASSGAGPSRTRRSEPSPKWLVPSETTPTGRPSSGGRPRRCNRPASLTERSHRGPYAPTSGSSINI
jgi:hypothetical protein